MTRAFAAGLAGGAAALAALGAAGLAAAPAEEAQLRGATSLRLSTVSADFTIPAGRTVSRRVVCPRGRTPLWWGFSATQPQTPGVNTITTADLLSALAVRVGARAGMRLSFRGGAAPIPAFVDLTCLQGRAGLTTRLAPRGAAARRAPTRPTVTVTSRLGNRTVPARSARELVVLCRPGALASTYGFTQRGSSFQGARPTARGPRRGFRLRFLNTTGRASRVTGQAICHEPARLPRTRTANLGVQRVAQFGGAPRGTISQGYVTVDNVQTASFLFPEGADYFTGIPPESAPRRPEGGGLRSEENGAALWGDFRLDPGAAQGETLVHIEGAPGSDFDGGTGYTFYGRYLNGRTGSQSDIFVNDAGTTRPVTFVDPPTGAQGQAREQQAPPPGVPLEPPRAVATLTLSTPFLVARGIRVVDARRPRDVATVAARP